MIGVVRDDVLGYFLHEVGGHDEWEGRREID